jgi:hypothetical protein
LPRAPESTEKSRKPASIKSAIIVAGVSALLARPGSADSVKLVGVVGILLAFAVAMLVAIADRVGSATESGPKFAVL